MAEGFGSYLEQVTFDEKQGSLWSIDQEHMKSVWSMPENYMVLPSDNTKREDLKLIAAKDWKNAEDTKHRLEELQRHDKKIRTQSANNKAN